VHRTCHVDDDIELSETRERRRDDALYVGLVERVAGYGRGFPAVRFDVSDGLSGSFGRKIADGYACAFAGEKQRDRTADVRPGSEDDGDFARQSRNTSPRQETSKYLEIEIVGW
jgi:hypothetical protein